MSAMGININFRNEKRAILNRATILLFKLKLNLKKNMKDKGRTMEIR